MNTGYKSYLNSSYWRGLRETHLNKKCHSYCKICGETQDLNLHHKRYKSLSGKSLLFREHGDNLVTLCISCHGNFHREFGKKNLSRKILSRLQKMANQNQALLPGT